MKKILYVLLMCWGGLSLAQEDFLPKRYFEDGEFEKAKVLYEKLVKEHPARSDYAEQLVYCYQQLKEYDKASEFLIQRLEYGPAFPTIFVDLGYNYRLQGNSSEAEIWYQKALDKIEENPNFGYGVGFKFQRYTLLDYALKAYQKAMELNPQLDYNFQIARIYGEQGDIEKMYKAYLELIHSRKASTSNVLRNLQQFINADPNNENNLKFKRVLLQNAQQNPDILWNEMLSWLFIQQEQYNLAFSQEKALFKRTESSNLDRIIELGRISLDGGDATTAYNIYEYIVKESRDPVAILNARLHMIDIDLNQKDKTKLNTVQKEFEALMDTYGYQGNTLQLQMAYARFLTFKLDKAGEAVTILKNSLELPLSGYSEAYIKLALGDILVYDQRFNEALILFSQVQKRLKNDVLGQEARFKVAQTSFYKGDFEWALTQLKVLRNSASQLIANDAMQLSLVISDNSLEDSTQTALKKYARADLLGYQKRTQDAIVQLDDILEQHKGEKIEDEALLKQGNLYEELEEYEAAALNYKKIIAFYGQDILADDAHFALGELYRLKLNKPMEAMENYERIILNYEDSYYFPQARKLFRKLRGDPVN